VTLLSAHAANYLFSGSVKPSDRYWLASFLKVNTKYPQTLVSPSNFSEPAVSHGGTHYGDAASGWDANNGAVPKAKRNGCGLFS
jgi:hypothetical protein